MLNTERSSSTIADDVTGIVARALVTHGCSTNLSISPAPSRTASAIITISINDERQVLMEAKPPAPVVVPGLHPYNRTLADCMVDLILGPDNVLGHDGRGVSR